MKDERLSSDSVRGWLVSPWYVRLWAWLRGAKVVWLEVTAVDHERRIVRMERIPRPPSWWSLRRRP